VSVVSPLADVLPDHQVSSGTWYYRVMSRREPARLPMVLLGLLLVLLIAAWGYFFYHLYRG
jgi:hypothetical protein